MNVEMTLANTDWVDDGARKAMVALNSGYGKTMALFVGGCVRNALMARGDTDIDIATIHTPDQTMAILKARNIKVIPTGIDHGTVTAVIGDIHYEITTLRRDVETTGRHAVVTFTEDWCEDALRRDFTMNTLLCDLKGNIYDPLGQGVNDAIAKRVVFVGEAAQRIQEDYLRILRFFRFHAWYGAGEPDQNALDACKKYAAQIDTLSKERIAQEFLKIMAADDPVAVLGLIRKCSILPQCFGTNYDSTVLDRLSKTQREQKAENIVTRLVTLGGMDADMRGIYADTMTLSNKQQKQYSEILAACEMLANGTDVKIAIYKCSNDIARQALMLYSAANNIDADYAIFETWQAPVFPVNGQDLIEAGIAQGPEMGRIMRTLEEYWLQNDFAPDKSSLLARIK